MLLLDVLEHLYDPWRALTRIRTWLAAGTRVLASVPNIRNLVNPVTTRRRAWNTALTASSMLRTCDSLRAPRFGGCSRRRFMPSRIWSLSPSRWVDRYVSHDVPEASHEEHIVAFRNRDDLEDLYAFQYVIDACLPPRHRRVGIRRFRRQAK